MYIFSILIFHFIFIKIKFYCYFLIFFLFNIKHVNVKKKFFFTLFCSFLLKYGLMQLLLSSATLNSMLPLLAIIAGVFVITTKNAIISVFNLIVLYILVSFYLIYIGVTYLGISYIIIYIDAIAILFLFVIMMIDIEVVEKRSNNYLPLLFLLLGGFFFTLKNILYNIGIVKMKSLSINIIKKPIIHDSLFKLEAGLNSSELN